VTLRNIRLLVQLSRPFFLLGGFLLVAVGSLIARSMGAAIDPVLYLQGQAIVSTLQLMVHFSNEYFDAPGDRGNRQRTPFSGGSGALAADGLSRSVAAWGAATAAVGFVLVFGRMLTTGTLPNLSIWVTAAMTFGAWSYSAPPLRLVGRGLGEIVASLVVAVLVPTLAFTLQTGFLAWGLVVAVVPMFLVHGAMLVVLEIPDIEADLQSGKRTLVARMGVPASARLHLILIILGVATLIVSRIVGLGPSEWRPIAIVGLAACVHAVQLRRSVRSGRGWTWTAGAAVGLFALTALAEAVGFLST
jgi:1,4-dihydroxy-2-naphthoate octaprenyltransferase